MNPHLEEFNRLSREMAMNLDGAVRANNKLRESLVKGILDDIYKEIKQQV